MRFCTNKWKRQQQRKAVYPAVAESVLEGMLNAGVPAHLPRFFPPTPASYALGDADRSLVRCQFRRHNRLFRVDVGKGGIHLHDRAPPPRSKRQWSPRHCR